MVLRIATAEGVTDATYTSVDNGDSWSVVAGLGGGNAGCFRGDTFILGSKLSLDGGASWGQLNTNPDSNDPSDHRPFIDNSACIIHPADAEQAMSASGVGPARTDDLQADPGPPTWEDAVEGIEGVRVYSVSQSAETPDRVLLATNSGLALSHNFLDENPEWQFPICPGGDCVGSGNLVMDPANDSIVYVGSGNIRKGEISSSGGATSINWSDFKALPGNMWFFGTLDMYEFLPNKLIAAYWRVEGGINGGLYIYDTANPAAEPEIQLAGLPIEEFIALNSQLWFAALGVSNSAEQEQYRGIYRTTDGGATWNEMSDPDFPELVRAVGFAYDPDNDILFAALQRSRDISTFRGGVLRLQNAAAGGTDWELIKSADFPGSDQVINLDVDVVAVDKAETRYVYAAADNHIWVSLDHGGTWQVYYAGLLHERTYTLFAPIKGATPSVRAAGAEGLTQGANTGFYRMTVSPGPDVSAVTPAKAALKRKGKTLKVAMSPLAGVSYQLEWKIVRAMANGKKKKINKQAESSGPDFTIKKLRNADRVTVRYRYAVGETASHLSPAAVKRIRIKKKGT